MKSSVAGDKPFRLGVMAAATIIATGLSIASAAAEGPSLLMWPITSVVEPSARAAALWLENKGDEPVSLQIRVLGWKQTEHADTYEEQSRVVASPPLATIAPGKRQLIRLTKLAEAPAGQESAYRVLIDELPPATTDPGRTDAMSVAVAIKVRMRYSLPLFVYGAGLQPVRADERPERRPESGLKWHLVSESGRRWLVVRNEGRTFARLSQVKMGHAEHVVSVAEGLLGYVLPGAEMRWPLTDETPSGIGVPVEASVNGTLVAALSR